MDNKKTAKTLCIWSLVCHLSSIVLFAALAAAVHFIFTNIDSNVFVFLTIVLFFLPRIAAWILVIIAKVKDKKSKFALVLIWIYIGVFILLSLLLAVFVVVELSGVFREMFSFLH